MKHMKRALSLCLSLLMIFGIFGVAMRAFVPSAEASDLKPLFSQTDDFNLKNSLYGAKQVVEGEKLKQAVIPYIPKDFSFKDIFDYDDTSKWMLPETINGTTYRWSYKEAQDAAEKLEINHKKTLAEWIFRGYLAQGVERIVLGDDLKLYGDSDDGDMNYRYLSFDRLTEFIYQMHKRGKVTDSQRDDIITACQEALFPKRLCSWIVNQWGQFKGHKEILDKYGQNTLDYCQTTVWLVFRSACLAGEKLGGDTSLRFPDGVNDDPAKWSYYGCKNQWPIKIKHNLYLDLNGYTIEGYEATTETDRTMFLVEGEGTSRTTPVTLVINDSHNAEGGRTGTIRFRGPIQGPGDGMNEYAHRNLFQVDRNGNVYVLNGNFASGNMDETDTESTWEKIARIWGKIIKSIVPIASAGVSIAMGATTGNIGQVVSGATSLIGATTAAVQSFKSDDGQKAAQPAVTYAPDGSKKEADKDDVDGKNAKTDSATTADQKAALAAKGGKVDDSQGKPGGGASAVVSQRGWFEVTAKSTKLRTKAYVDDPAAAGDVAVDTMVQGEEIMVKSQYNADYYVAEWSTGDVYVLIKAVQRETGAFKVVKDAIVRKAPSPDAEKYDETVKAGTMIEVVGEREYVNESTHTDGKYYMFKYKSDEIGYIWEEDVKATKADTLKDITNRQAAQDLEKWNNIKSKVEEVGDSIEKTIANHISKTTPRTDRFWVVNHGSVFKVKLDGKVVILNGKFVGFGQDQNNRESVIENDNGEVYVYNGEFEGHAGANIFNHGKFDEGGGSKTKFFVRGGTFTCTSVDNLRGKKQKKLDNNGNPTDTDEDKPIIPGTKGGVNLLARDYGTDLIADGRIQICELSGIGDLVYKDPNPEKGKPIEYKLYCTDEELQRMTYATVTYRDSDYMSRTFSLRGSGEFDMMVEKHKYLVYDITDGTAFIAPVINGDATRLPEAKDYSDDAVFWYYNFPWTTFLRNMLAYKKNSSLSTGWMNYKMVSGMKAYKYELYMIDPVTEENLGDPIATKTVSTSEIVTGQLFLAPNAELGGSKSNGYYLYDNWVPGCMYRVKLTITEYVDVGLPSKSSMTANGRQVYSAASSTSLIIRCTEDYQTPYTPVKFTDPIVGVGDVAEVDFYNAKVGRVDVFGEKIFAVNYDWRVCMSNELHPTPDLSRDLPLVTTKRYIQGGSGNTVSIYGHPYDQREVANMINYEGYPIGFLGEFDQTLRAPVSKHPDWSSTDRLEIPDFVPDPDNPAQNYKDGDGNPVAVAGKRIYCHVTYGLCSYRWAKAYKDLATMDMTFHNENINPDYYATPRDVKSFDTAMIEVLSQPQGAKLKTDDDAISTLTLDPEAKVYVPRGGFYTVYADEPVDVTQLFDRSEDAIRDRRLALMDLHEITGGFIPIDLIGLTPGLIDPAMQARMQARIDFNNPDLPVEFHDMSELDTARKLKDFMRACAESNKTARIVLATYEWHARPASAEAWTTVASARRGLVSYTLRDIQEDTRIFCARTLRHMVCINGEFITNQMIQKSTTPLTADMPYTEVAKDQRIAMTNIVVSDKIVNMGFSQVDTVGSNNGKLQSDGWFFDKYSNTLRFLNYNNSGTYYTLGSVAGLINTNDDLTIDLRGDNVLTLDVDRLPDNITELAIIRAKTITFIGDGTLTINVKAPAATLKKLAFLKADSVTMLGKGKVQMNLINDQFADTIKVRFADTDLFQQGSGRIGAYVKTRPATAANCMFMAGTGDSMIFEVLNSDTRGLTVYEGATESAGQLVTESQDKLNARMKTAMNVGFRASEVETAHIHEWTASVIYKSATLTETGIARISCAATLANKQPCPEHKDTVIPIFGVYNANAYASANNQITVSWDQTLEASGYEVFRYNDGKKDFVKLADVKAAAKETYSYVDKDLVAGQTYRYKIRAVKTGTNPMTSALCSEVSAMAYVTPAIPVGVKAAPTGDRKITVSWTASNYATRYDVYNANTGAPLGSTSAKDAKPTQFEVSGLADGSTNSFYVIAVMELDKGQTAQSEPSATVSGKAYALRTPDNFSAANSKTAHAVDVSWNTVPTATGYAVYRSLKDADSYTQVGTVEAVSGKDTYVFTDTSAAGNTAYNYKVAALRNVDNSTVVSDRTAPVVITTGKHNLTKVAGKPATCTAAGNVEYYTCSVCKKNFSDANGTKELTDVTLKAKNHSWGAWTNLDASQHQRVCANDKTHVEKAAHTWDAGKVTKAATETEEGVKTYTCTVCNGTKTEKIAKLAPSHTHDYKLTSDANSHWYVCSCGATKDKAAHTWDAGKVTAEATTKADGAKLFTCTVCKATKTEKIASLDYMLGDVDDNKKIEGGDARLALRIAVGLEPTMKAGTKEYKAANVDKVSAGKVEGADARLILRKAVSYVDPEWGK